MQPPILTLDEDTLKDEVRDLVGGRSRRSSTESSTHRPTSS